MFKLFEEWSTEAPGIGTDWSFLPEEIVNTLVPNFLSKLPPAGRLTIENHKEIGECITANERLNEEYEDVLFITESSKTPWMPFVKLLKAKGENIIADDVRPLWENQINTTIIHKLKEAIKRSRPYWISEKVKPFEECESSSYSFPSEHASGAYYMGLQLADRFPRHREDIMSTAKRIADSRVYSGVSFPSDVLAGKLIGEVLHKRNK